MTTEQRTQVASAAAKLLASGRTQSIQEGIIKIMNCIREESLWVK